MPTPRALCIEDLQATGDDRFLQCVASVGVEPLLGLDAEGRVAQGGDLACELFVSQDDRLILLRCGSVSVIVSRDGRSVDAPAGKPVVLLDQDEVQLSGRRLQIHVHGEAEEIHRPRPFVERARVGLATVAAAAALGASAVGSGQPPQERAPRQSATEPAVEAPDGGVRPDAGAPKPKVDPKRDPIEVRPHPPKPMIKKK